MTQNVLKGTINIPKDLVVKSGAVVEVVFVEGTGGDPDSLHEGTAAGPDVTEFIVPTGGTATESDAGKYIKLVIQNDEDKPLFIAVKDLVDVYTGGQTDEVTVSIDVSNEITAEIRKVSATKSIYRAAAAAHYDEDTTVSGDNWATKVAAGLYTFDGTNYVQVQSTDSYDSAETYYTYTPAVTELNVKDKIDDVEAKLDAEIAYVGRIPAGATATDVVGYVDEKTAGGVGSLNGQAGVADKDAQNVVTLKGSVIEVEGIIQNGPTTAFASVVQGYYDAADTKKFYTEATFENEITPDTSHSYEDQATGGLTYNWTGKMYVPITPDVTLDKVAVTGAAEDVDVADAGSYFTGTNVETVLQEVGQRLTWVEV